MTKKEEIRKKNYGEYSSCLTFYKENLKEINCL